MSARGDDGAGGVSPDVWAAADTAVGGTAAAPVGDDLRAAGVDLRRERQRAGGVGAADVAVRGPGVHAGRVRVRDGGEDAGAVAGGPRETGRADRPKGGGPVHARARAGERAVRAG